MFERKNRQGQALFSEGLFGPNLKLAGDGVSNTGRSRLPIRLMVPLLYLNLGDKELVALWTENVQFGPSQESGQLSALK